MVDDGLKYDIMVEQALRGVLREALVYVAENGLPGEHHFYITFRTDHPDVDIPDHLHERYASEMTIVLQHQYWSLEVSEESFGVTLSFSDIPERLTVPFDSVVAFADPSVRFGLQFDGGAATEEAAGEGDRPSAEIETLPVGAAKVDQGNDETLETPAPKAAKKPKKSRRKAAKKSAAEKPEDKAADAGGKDDDPEKVIALDSFRKK